MDLMTASPREVDEYAASLHEKLGKAEYALRTTLDQAHHLLGEKPNCSRGGKIIGWPTGDSDIASRLRTATNIAPHEQRTQVRILATLTDLTDRTNNLTADLAAVEAAFTRRGGWSRFFTVDGGHIHSGVTCAGGTIRPSTRLGWNPELSGKLPQVAVMELGPLLCTHCFPSAPVEWTKGVDKGHCAGSGESPRSGARVWRAGSSTYGVCPECKEGQRLTRYGTIRAHRPPKS